MADPAASIAEPHAAPVSFDTHPSRYRHWRLSVQGAVATLTMDVNEQAGIRPGYRLKLNSYDLGVDIELYDALLVTGAAPVLNALNEKLRDDYIRDSVAGVGRCNRIEYLRFN
jgi:hypothetical protein